MRFLNRCNGTGPSVRLGESARELLASVVGQARADFHKWASNPICGGSYSFGVRFRSNDDVLYRIESAVADEAEFLADPQLWVLDALRDCAAADHYYAFEKDWGEED